MGQSTCNIGQRRRLAALALWAAVAIPLHAASDEPASAEGRELTATRADPQWDAAFTRTQGWTGGDVIGSVELNDGRTVWMFGDSWVGRVADGKHVPGSRLVNNSIAIHRSHPGRLDEPPAADELEFYWGSNDRDGHPTAWIVPRSAKGQAEAGPSGHSPPTWFWTTGGGVLLPKHQGAARLVLFLFHVGRRNDENSVWNFEHLGSAMAIVDNPGDRAENWKFRQLSIPYAISAKQSRLDPRREQTSWGMAAFVDSDAESPGTQFVYIYGVRESRQTGKRAVLARVSPADIEQFARWQFYLGGGRWTSDPSKAVTIADEIVSEFSVHRHKGSGHPQFVMVHSQPVFGTEILIRTAPRPQGPWSDPVSVYKVPDVERNATYFTYAAKGHAHLSRPGELLLSYVVNSHDFKSMVDDASIYRPRFVRVPLSALGFE